MTKNNGKFVADRDTKPSVAAQTLEDILRRRNAFWLHDGDRTKPHVVLTQGLCSNAYFNLSKVLSNPHLCQWLAELLTKELSLVGITEVDWVVGSAYAAITLSYEVAKIFDAEHGFVEKDCENPRRMVWHRFEIPNGSKVLQIEELISSGHTLLEVRRAVQEGNQNEVNFLPIVGTLIHRPTKLPVNYQGLTVIALWEKEFWVVPPEDCLLCQAGSVRYRPKNHWRELTGKP